MNGGAVSEDEIALPERRSNRPVTLLHRIEYVAFLGLFYSFRLIGVDASSAIAGRFLRTFGPLIRPLTRRAENNLALIYPEWPAEKRRAVIKDICENIGRTAGEFPHLARLAAASDATRLAIVGADRLPLNGAPPGIFVSSHSANWEVIPATFQRLGVENAFVYRAANNPLTDEFIIRHRASVMSRRQIPKGKRGGRALVDNLKAGRSLLMLVDQKLNSGIEVPFMGRPAMTAPAAARLSLKYDTPITPVRLERLNGARFQMTIGDAISFSPSGDLNNDIHALTAKVNEALEADIRAQPGQWLWFHRRWPKSD